MWGLRAQISNLRSLPTKVGRLMLAPLNGGAEAGGAPALPSLDFSKPSNSQYVAVLIL